MSMKNENIVSPVTFTFSARGDLGSSSEYFQVFDENGQLLTQINGNNYDCDESFDYVTYLSNTNQLSQWLADGVINFTFQASYAVDGFCEYTDVGVMFSYNGIDYNQNISIYDYDISWYPSNFNFYINDASSLVTSLNGNLSISEDQSIGNYDLEVYNYDTESWVLGQSLFSITEPTSLDGISPENAFQGQLLDVTISGTNMNFSESFSNYSPYYDYDVYSSWQLIF